MKLVAYLSLKGATAGVEEGRFCWIWLEISHFFKYKNGIIGFRNFLVYYWNDFVLGCVKTFFLDVGAYVSLKGATAGFWEGRFCWIWLKNHISWNKKTEEWELMVLLFNYWNGLLLGSVETYFLEVGMYMSLKGATAGVWKFGFCLIWLEISHSLNIKTGECDLKSLLFNYWNDLVLGSVEIFLEAGACACLKGGTTGIWECHLPWSWREISYFLKYKNGGVRSKKFIV